MSSPVTAATLHAQAYFDDPFPVWEQLRHEQPLFHDTVDDRWLLTRYDDVAAVFRDHETYSTRPYLRIFTDVIGPTMVQMDGADHDVRRAIVAPAMVGRQLEEHYLGLVDTVVRGLFDRLPATGPVDLMGDVTAPLPLKVVATILGMREEDDEYLHGVTNQVIAALAGEEPARSEGIAAHAAFTQHIDRLITDRVAAPGTDSSAPSHVAAPSPESRCHGPRSPRSSACSWSRVARPRTEPWPTSGGSCWAIRTCWRRCGRIRRWWMPRAPNSCAATASSCTRTVS